MLTEFSRKQSLGHAAETAAVVATAKVAPHGPDHNMQDTDHDQKYTKYV